MWVPVKGFEPPISCDLSSQLSLWWCLSLHHCYRLKCFELTKSKQCNEHIVTIWNIMIQYKNSVVTICLTHNLIDLISSSKEHSLLYYMHIIYQLIWTFLNIFIDLALAKISCSEDVHYDIYLLKYFIKTQEDARKVTSTFYNELAIKSKYYKLAKKNSSSIILTQVKINSVNAFLNNIQIDSVLSNNDIELNHDSEKKNNETN